jgi:hypothetical protein
VGFSRLLGAIKGCLRVSPWILYASNVMAVIILARSNQNYPSVAPNSQVVSEVTELRNADSVP